MIHLIKRWPYGQIGCWVIGLLIWISPLQAQEADGKCYKRDYTLNILAENDLWGSGSDKHFTHGTRLSFVDSREVVEDSQSCAPEDRESGGLDFIRNLFDPVWSASTQTNQVSFILGQNIFTPEDITNPNLIVNDRPYAGWLYFGFGLIRSDIRKEGFAIFDTLELDLGIVGPESYAEDIQIWWHENISDSPRPAGWDHQLKNEPGILLNLERKWRMELTPHDYEGVQVDFLPNVGVALGNVYTYGATGVMFRLGVNLPVDYGPPRIRPGAQGSDFFQYDKQNPVSWYVYAGVEGRAMAVNIFLDGNTFTDSHSVDKKYFVGDFHAGFVLVIHRVRLSLSQVFRTPEFDGQKENDEFGSISLSIAW